MSRAYYDAGSTGFFTGKLLDDDKRPIPWANLTSLELDLRDARAGGTVNARSHQNVLAGSAGTPLHGVSVDATTGQLDWTVEAADLTPLVAAADHTVHAATFAWEGTDVDGKPVAGSATHELVILQPTRLMLCTIDDVEEITGTIQDSDLDMIERRIIAITKRFEDYCGRRFKYVENDVLLCSGGPATRTLWLPRFPVVSVASVKEHAYSDFTTPNAAADLGPDTANPYYALLKGGIQGYSPAAIRFREPRSVSGDNVWQVTFTGGAWRETAGVDDDLKLAAMEQVAYAWQRRDALGVSGMSAGQGGNVSFGQSGDTGPFVRYEKDLLPSVRSVLDQQYRAIMPSF